jgi:hypothetical protein
VLIGTVRNGNTAVSRVGENGDGVRLLYGPILSVLRLPSESSIGTKRRVTKRIVADGMLSRQKKSDIHDR